MSAPRYRFGEITSILRRTNKRIDDLFVEELHLRHLHHPRRSCTSSPPRTSTTPSRLPRRGHSWRSFASCAAQRRCRRTIHPRLIGWLPQARLRSSHVQAAIESDDLLNVFETSAFVASLLHLESRAAASATVAVLLVDTAATSGSAAQSVANTLKQ